MRPDFANAHYDRACVLDDRHEYGAAIAAFRRALRARPDFLQAHYRLAIDLLYQEGRYEEAKAQIDRAARLVKADDPIRAALAQHRAVCDRERALEPRLDAYLRGEIQPSVAEDACQLAQLAAWPHRQLFGAASRLYARAFALEPTRGDDLHNGYRYHAASCAAKAGCGQGRERLPDEERARWREQALRWLRADLALRRRQIEGGDLKAAADARVMLRIWRTASAAPDDPMAPVRGLLRIWQNDPAFAGLRDPESLNALPRGEGEAWRAFWHEAEALVTGRDARSGKTPAP